MPKPFNCSTCAAPLDAEAIKSVTVRCGYCGNTILIPDALRDAGTTGSADNAGNALGHVVNEALRLAEVARLVKAKKKIEAIKLYREIFPVGLKEAKDAVEQIETTGTITYSHSTTQASQLAPSRFASVEVSRGRSKGSRPGNSLLWLVAAVSVVGLLGGVIAAIVGFASFFAPGSSPSQETTARPTSQTTATARVVTPPTPAFADVALEFGAEGIGAGQFKDARSVAVDGEGRIYVGEYTGGRVQVFDSQGRFLTQWLVDPKPVLLNLAADRKGNVYVVHPGSIIRYEGATGRLLGEVPKQAANRFEYYEDVFVALDGSLFAISGNHKIVRISPEGEIKVVVDVREKTGENVSLDRVAVDGTGNIYALDRSGTVVFKFSPDGRFISRFGGRGDQPGQFISPHNIAVDGKGRVYVSDSGRAVNVFDSGGRFIDSFGGRELVFGLAVTDNDEIFTAQRNRNKIVKFVLRK
ncbi:MAG TPA: NHL repeat-containing protein [Blastocatellia bacterium]|nr:NHL repeat-containing protein [Blastocatellia bacterium]